ncbi:hypothetical protein FQR65_LT19953 [Abscondita terminalis]|nr:hypothetical protein FQR65_LT19953 [Abscondita terminalis]
MDTSTGPSAASCTATGHGPHPLANTPWAAPGWPPAPRPSASRPWTTCSPTRPSNGPPPRPSCRCGPWPATSPSPGCRAPSATGSPSLGGPARFVTADALRQDGVPALQRMVLRLQQKRPRLTADRAWPSAAQLRAVLDSSHRRQRAPDARAPSRGRCSHAETKAVVFTIIKYS